jgi:hypothetical protein
MNWLKLRVSHIADKKAGHEPETLTEPNQHLGRAIDVCGINSGSFTIQYKHVGKVLNWSDVSEIFAFNADLITTDQIGLEIICEGTSYFIDEDLPGWSQFVENSKAVLIGISHEWESNIIQPPLTQNRLIIYSRS